MPLRNVVFFCLLAAGVFASGCDSAPGAEDTSSVPPVVSELQYSPQTVTLSELPASDVTADSAGFLVTVEVTAVDSDGSVREVSYALQAPDNASLPVASGTMAAVGNDRYRATFTLRIARGRVGNYTIAAFAIDDSGRMSNTVRGSITYRAAGDPPVIREVLAEPDTIRVTRDSTLVLIAFVEDPDGIDNIARVVIRTPNGAEREMRDDGASFDDPVAGDGEYRARFENVHLATPNTTQTFAFQAYDKTGLASEIVEKAVRIE